MLLLSTGSLFVNVGISCANKVEPVNVIILIIKYILFMIWV